MISRHSKLGGNVFKTKALAPLCLSILQCAQGTSNSNGQHIFSDTGQKDCKTNRHTIFSQRLIQTWVQKIANYHGRGQGGLQNASLRIDKVWKHPKMWWRCTQLLQENLREVHDCILANGKVGSNRHLRRKRQRASPSDIHCTQGLNLNIRPIH